MTLVTVLLLALAARGTLQMDAGDVVTDPNTLGFQAAIQPLADGVSLGVCSGVVIKGSALNGTTYVDKYFILTAASCVVPATSCNVYLRPENIRVDSVPDLAGVTMADMVIHPDFLTSALQSSDLAIITADGITTAFNANNKLTAATLPSIENAEDSYVASGVSLTAWGYGPPREPTGERAPALLQVDTYVWPNLFCSVFHPDKHISKKHVCSGGLIHGAPCSGDAGAPLIRKNRVVGLATMVPADGCGRKPGVFTRLGSYLAWIIKTTNYDPYQ
ncbi:mite allergen Der p 3-like [Thrips palmi]|uniref:Mite allergen Der p 3-like n=1 Tax=Thrips palmi TaxID=161013 RepID=A0A6P8ZVA3_THRPL|nr:mite allergen Der p 3-like [Thrips palmi]